MKRGSIFLFFFLGALVFSGLIVYGDMPQLLRSLSAFSPVYWLAAIGLALVNYLLRLVRWNIYLKLVGIKSDFRTSASIFFAGLSMTLSPGRVGELAKSYFLKDKLGVPVAVSAPVVITERIADLASILLLGTWGLVFIPFGWIVIIGVFAGLSIFIGLLSSPWGIDHLARFPVLRRWKPYIATSGQSFRKLLSLKVMIMALLLGCAAWFAEGLAFWLVIRGLGHTLPVPMAVAMYCGASLFGAVSMLPGGLISTEGSMVALLLRAGLNNTLASGATLIIRVCTLWFAIAVGFLGLLYLQFYLPRKAASEAAPDDLPVASGKLAEQDGD